MKRLKWLACAAVWLASVAGQAAASVAVPPELANWKAWVLQDQAFRACPMRQGQAGQSEGEFQCQASGALQLDVRDGGARFEWPVTLWQAGEISLPGDVAHWPQALRSDAGALAVLERDGLPVLRLPAGQHRLSGEFRWTQRPGQLRLPASLASVLLTLDGVAVAHPQRDDLNLTLGKGETASNQPADVAVQIWRRLADGQPLTDELRLRLTVSGPARAQTFGPVLLPGFLATAVHSSLTARLDGEGFLHLQLRPGQHELVIHSRAAALPASLNRPTAPAPWPAQELWSWQAEPSLRDAGLNGLPAVDPAQSAVPPEWQSLPAFSVAADARAQIEERSRGRADGGNRLQLGRTLWRRHDGSGWTLRDVLSGEMRRDWRLAMAEPLQLQAARNGAGLPWPVSRGSADDVRPGLEWRDGQLSLQALLTAGADATLPVSGWSQHFDQVNWTLQLPPASLLLATSGISGDHSSWLARWNLLDCFALVLLAVLAFRLAGWPLAALALAGVGWLFHSIGPAIWLFVHAAAGALAARHVLSGRLGRWIRNWALLGLLALVVFLLPFVAGEVRTLLHPQLEPYGQMWTLRQAETEVQDAAVSMVAPAPIASVEEAMSRKPKLADRDFEGAGQRYDESAATGPIAAGPGEPEWAWQSHHFVWNGPVSPEQTAQLYFLQGGSYRLVQALALLLLLAVSVRLLAEARPILKARARDRAEQAEEKRRREAGAAGVATLTSAVLTAVMLAALAGPVLHSPAEAADTGALPTPELLAELKTRLTQPPACAPNCAQLASAKITAQGDKVQAELLVHAGHASLLPLPGAENWPREARLNGELAPLHRDNGQWWLAVSAGVHRVELSGLAAGDTLRIGFPLPPRELRHALQGWAASGGKGGALELQRESPSGGGDSRAAGEVSVQVAPLVRVVRRLSLQREWTLDTRVERLAPLAGAFAVSLPLLPDEQPLSPDLQIQNSSLQLSFGPAESEKSWQSRLPAVDVLRWTLPEVNDRVEVWVLAPDLRWRLQAAGTPEVLPAAPGEWQFAPRAGETLTVQVQKAETLGGAAFAIDGIEQEHHQGDDGSSGSLNIRWRATTGGDQILGWPEGLELISVTVDGTALNLSARDGQLRLPTQPGAHDWQISYQQADDAALMQGLPQFGLPVPAANVKQTLHLSERRWLLWTAGPQLGPAVLYWSVLLVFGVLAFALSRQQWLPLSFRDALWLGLGLSTVSWWVLLLTVAWLAVVRVQQKAGGEPGRWRMAVVLLLTVGAVLTLIGAVPMALLSNPDMMLAGTETGAGVLHWFSDVAETQMPAVLAFSLPMWIYKGAMLLWAIWLSFALIKWLKLTWESLQKPA